MFCKVHSFIVNNRITGSADAGTGDSVLTSFRVQGQEIQSLEGLELGVVGKGREEAGYQL